MFCAGVGVRYFLGRPGQVAETRSWQSGYIGAWNTFYSILLEVIAVELLRRICFMFSWGVYGAIVTAETSAR